MFMTALINASLLPS